MKQYSRLREDICQANKELPKHGLVFHTFGNVSGIDRTEGVVAIKPSGVSYEELTPDDIVVVNLDGEIIDSFLRPSSDTKTHLVLYKHFPAIGGVVHTHSRFATAWAQAQKSIPCLGTTHADHARDSIPCTEIISDDRIQGDYEEETGRLIVERFAELSYEEIPMVLVAAHGPFTWGRTPGEAVENSLMLEYLAETAFLTLAINPGISDIKRSLIDKHFLRKHGSNAYYGQVSL